MEKRLKLESEEEPSTQKLSQALEKLDNAVKANPSQDTKPAIV